MTRAALQTVTTGVEHGPSLWFQICPDHNLKCYRLYVQDGIYGKDLGPLTGEDWAVEQQAQQILEAHGLLYGVREWVRR